MFKQIKTGLFFNEFYISHRPNQTIWERINTIALILTLGIRDLYNVPELSVDVGLFR